MKGEHCNLVCDFPKDFSHHLLRYLEDRNEEYRYLTLIEPVRHVSTVSSLVIHDVRYMCSHIHGRALRSSSGTEEESPG